MSVVRGPLSVAKRSLTTDNGQLTTDSSLLLLRRRLLLATSSRCGGSAFGAFFAFGGLAADDFGLGSTFSFNSLGRSGFKHFLHGGHDQLAILHGLHAHRKLEVLDVQDIVERHFRD